jgi:LAGLIDADG DNA endonuclease family
MKKTQISSNNNLDLKNSNNLISLPEVLNSILIGIMLGDGGMYRSSPTSNTRLEMSFGEKYKEFAESLGNIFKDYMSNPVKSIQIKGKNKIYTNYRIKTKSLPIFNQNYEMFYKLDPDNQRFVKMVPENISNLINPIVLAYLIMTDGNFYKSRNRVRIYTNSFRKDEVQMLALAINNKLGIYTGVLHDKKDQ